MDRTSTAFDLNDAICSFVCVESVSNVAVESLDSQIVRNEATSDSTTIRKMPLPSKKHSFNNFDNSLSRIIFS